jgi:hypothetical protein
MNSKAHSAQLLEEGAHWLNCYSSKAHLANQILLKTPSDVWGLFRGPCARLGYGQERNDFFSKEDLDSRSACIHLRKILGPSHKCVVHVLCQRVLTLIHTQSPMRLFKMQIPRPSAPNQNLLQFRTVSIIISSLGKSDACLNLRATSQKCLEKCFPNT